MMKLIIKSTDVQNAVAALASGVPSRPLRPLFGQVLLGAREGALSLRVWNGELSLSTAIAAEVERPGSVAVSASHFFAIAKNAPEGGFEIEQSKTKLIVRAGGQFQLFTSAADDWPALAPLKDVPSILPDVADLANALRGVVFACARETSRYAMQGVFCSVDKRAITLAATDGRRLARTVLGVTSCVEQTQIVPAAFAGQVLRLLGTCEDDTAFAELFIEDTRAAARIGNYEIHTTLVDGTFPDYKSVIPTEVRHVAAVSRDDLLSAVQRAAVMTTPDSLAVKFSFSSAGIVLQTAAPETGQSEIVCAVKNYQGESIAIGLNPRFLMQALRAVAFEDVRLEMTSPQCAIVICAAADEGPTKGGYVSVLMPVALRGALEG